MEKFTVALKFEADVSESAADDLEYLVAEFLQGVLNIVANDEFDRAVEAEQAPVHTYENCQLCQAADEGSDAPGVTDHD